MTYQDRSELVTELILAQKSLHGCARNLQIKHQLQAMGISILWALGKCWVTHENQTIEIKNITQLCAYVK